MLTLQIPDHWIIGDCPGHDDPIYFVLLNHPFHSGQITGIQHDHKHFIQFACCSFAYSHQALLKKRNLIQLLIRRKQDTDIVCSESLIGNIRLLFLLTNPLTIGKDFFLHLLPHPAFSG